MAVVGLDDFDVHTIIQHLRRQFQQPEAEIDADAHVRREDDGNGLGGAGDGGFLLGGEAGGADDHGLASLLAQRQMGERRCWPGEVNQHVEIPDQWRQIGGDGHVQSPEACKFASVGAEQGMIGMFRGHGAAHPLDQMAGFEQMAAHTASRAGDGDVNHGGDSSLQCLK